MEMAKTVGVVISDRVVAGLVVDHKLVGPLRMFPESEDNETGLVELHTDALIKAVCERVVLVANGSKDLTAVGVALPGVIRNGVVEDSPNLPQLKGARIAELLTRELHEQGIEVPVRVLNDADGMAAGLAAVQGRLNSLIRVWTLGVGIGYGQYPFSEGVFEGGHTTVSLDEKERYCGCGGRGHMEGIMGYRAMRLRFLDMEPEEVFAEARKSAAESKDAARCMDFVRLWHKALAAATASSIHVTGAGKFLVTGFTARYVDLSMLKDYLGQMVKLSPLQGYTIEIVEDLPETRVIGSAVTAEQANAVH